MPDLSKDYDSGFFKMHEPWQAEYDRIGELMMQHFEFRNVIDFGCGNGFVLSYLSTKGKSVTGVDGSPNVKKYFPDAVISDLTVPHDFGKFDLVICTEVAEHIAAEFADILVDNLCTAARDNIFFSAATAGFGGHCHVNEQERGYWIAKFEARGFIVDSEATESIARVLRHKNNHTWWFAKNCFVLKRKRLLLPAIRIETETLDGLPSRMMSREDRRAMIALLKRVNPRVVVEIGVNEGFSAEVILRYIGSIEKYIGIDVPPDHVTVLPQQRLEVPVDPAHLVKNDPRFQLMIKPRGSRDVSASDLGPVDAVIIDGDHGRESILHDSALALACVRSGGIIFWHDYNEQCTVDVVPVLNELYSAGRPLLHVEGTWLAFQWVY